MGIYYTDGKGTATQFIGGYFGGSAGTLQTISDNATNLTTGTVTMGKLRDVVLTINLDKTILAANQPLKVVGSVVNAGKRTDNITATIPYADFINGGSTTIMNSYNGGVNIQISNDLTTLTLQGSKETSTAYNFLITAIKYSVLVPNKIGGMYYTDGKGNATKIYGTGLAAGTILFSSPNGTSTAFMSNPGVQSTEVTNLSYYGSSSLLLPYDFSKLGNGIIINFGSIDGLGGSAHAYGTIQESDGSTVNDCLGVNDWFISAIPNSIKIPKASLLTPQNVYNNTVNLTRLSEMDNNSTISYSDPMTIAALADGRTLYFSPGIGADTFYDSSVITNHSFYPVISSIVTY